MDDNGESDDTNGDGEGVWSPDIEQCFREALLLFPPCGRRKHILQEEGGGKMYGRNELIARHIMMRTGKSRTRKQVSSHIQVLARRKAKAESTSTNAESTGVSSSPSNINGSSGNNNRILPSNNNSLRNQQAGYYDVWVDRPIVTQKIRLVEFSAFIEHRNHHQSVGNCGQVVGLNNNLIQAPLGSASLSISGPNITTESPSDFSLANQHTQMGSSQAYPIPVSLSSLVATHPLTSNHNLPAQFNQATSMQPNQHNHQQQQSIKKTQQQQQQQQQNNCINNSLQQPQGFVRHSYVRINYTLPLGRQANKLERIDIGQIQDKFPEIGGSDGLFQRGPSDSFFLVKFWADLNSEFEYNVDDQNSYFGFSSHFETIDPYNDITCSTKACSYGLQVVEKVEKIYGAFNSSNGRYSYDINRSPMCEFMIQFIKKLRQLPRASQMNSVLENFTVLQVITSESTSEILLCLAYVFEVASSSEQINGPNYHVYKLTKD